MVATPRLIEGGLAIDDRGEVSFVNDFDFTGVKRFYAVINHRPGLVRAWHAHRYETKYLFAIQGSALIGAVEIDNWQNTSTDAKVWRFILSAHKPAILEIPAGYANGFMSLTEDAKLIFFSTSTLEESVGDDIRYPARHWDIWTVAER